MARLIHRVLLRRGSGQDEAEDGAVTGLIFDADDDLQHEAIDLRLRQRVSAFLLQRVLRRP